MTQLPPFSPALDDRQTAEFLALSLALLAFPLAQDAVLLDALAWQFDSPEPPRDADLPILPPKMYPRLDAALIEATVRALQPPPPPPMDGFIGRRTELDAAVIGLLNERPVVIEGALGIGKTTLLRAIAHDPRIRKHFRRVWWIDSGESVAALGDAIGLALELPGVLRLDPLDQPVVAREFLASAGILLLIDDTEDVGAALAFGAGVTVVGTGTSDSADGAVAVTVSGLADDAASTLIGREDAEMLIQKMDGNPRALKLTRALFDEDSLDDAAIVGLIGDQPLTDLYAASFGALPADYQQIYALFPAGEAVRAEGIQAAIAGLLGVSRSSGAMRIGRALTFLERHTFIERVGDSFRAIYRVAEAGESLKLPTIPFPAHAFRSGSATEEPDSRSREARILYDRGLTLIDEARDVEAAALLSQALELREGHDHRHAIAETLVALARAAYLSGDDATALRHLEIAAEHLHELRDTESLNVVRIALARVYRRAGRLDAALSVLGDEAPPLDLAAIYAARGEWDAALEAYAREPDSIIARRGITYTLLSAKRYAEALAAIADYDDFNARFTRGLVYHLNADFERALAAYDRADTIVTLDTDRGPLARARGRALASLGQYREAAIRVGAEGTWFEAKLPRPAFARQAAGHALDAALLWANGEADSAEAAALHALHCPGERIDVEATAITQHVLGRIYTLRGDHRAALAAFEAALDAREAMAHRDETAIGLTLHMIATLHAMLGADDRAIANFRRALTHLDERSARLLTLLPLQAALARIGREADAIDVGEEAFALVNMRPELDLRTLGYTLAYHADLLFRVGRLGRAHPVFGEWQNGLARRASEAFDSPDWGVGALLIALIVRSVNTDDNGYSATLLIDLAEEALTITESHTPDSLAAWSARCDLGRLLLALERPADADMTLAPLFDPAQRLDEVVPSVARNAHDLAGRAQMSLSRFAEAAVHFEAAAALEPERVLAGRLLRESGAAYRSAGDEPAAAERFTAALTDLDRATVLDEHIAAMVDLGYARLRMAQFGGAIETFEEALGIVQELPDPTLMASVLTDLAAAHHTLGQYRRAAATYRRALGYHKTPERIAATLIALARSSAAMHMGGEAIEAYQGALSYDHLSDSERRALLIELAAACANMERYPAAIDAYQMALRLADPNSADEATIRRGLGAVYAQIGQHEDARVNFEQALAALENTDAATGGTLVAIAEAHRAQDQMVEALDAYTRALPYLDRATHSIERAAALRAMGGVHMGMGQSAEAITAWTDALDIERALPQQDGGRIVDTLTRIAAAHEARGELERATIRHHEALVYQDVRHAPDQYTGTLRTLGRLYTEMGRLGEAVKALEEALATEYTQPDADQDAIAEATKLLADVYRAQDRLDEAADLYRRVAALETANGEVQMAAASALASTLEDITRYENTLRAAEQSWTLLNRTAGGDLKSLLFVRALQAQTCGALGRWDEAEDYLDKLMALLIARRTEVDPASIDPVMRVFTMMLVGGDYESRHDHENAVTAYREALHIAEANRLTPALIWALRQKIGHRAAKKRAPDLST